MSTFPSWLREHMVEKHTVSGKTVAAGALSGLSAVGTWKLIEALTKKAEAGEPVTLDPATLALLIAMAQGINDTGKGIVTLSTGINTLLAAAGQPALPRRIEWIPYAQLLTIAGTVGSTARLSENTPFPGYIKEVVTHWPLGCNQLVDVAVGHGLVQLCPREGFIALNNATVSYPFNEYVEDPEDIWVSLRNGDGANPHTIVVTIRLEGLGQ